jgi:hypothetical protein
LIFLSTRTCHLGSAAADEVVHRLLHAQLAHRRQHAKQLFIYFNLINSFIYFMFIC